MAASIDEDKNKWKLGIKNNKSDVTQWWLKDSTLTGSFDLAIKKASEILNIRGKVLPSTLNDTHICAELEDGAYVEEEFNVRAVGKSPIKRVFLKNENGKKPKSYPGPL